MERAFLRRRPAIGLRTRLVRRRPARHDRGHGDQDRSGKTETEGPRRAHRQLRSAGLGATARTSESTSTSSCGWRDQLDNGTRLQAYKHYWTRRYLHLDGEGNAWFYREDGRYERLVGDARPHFNRVVLWRYRPASGGVQENLASTRKACHSECYSRAHGPYRFNP
jgi:hypothetical protein